MATTKKRYDLRHAQITAWAVVLISFALFCLFCGASAAGARWFLFDSNVDLAVRLTVSKGRVDVRSPDGTSTGVTGDQVLDTNGINLSTDSASQGYLTFEDNYSRRVVATVFLLQESTLTLGHRSRPRFDWSGNRYQLTLAEGLGHFVVRIENHEERPVHAEIQVARGIIIFEDSGTYRVDVSDSLVQVYAEQGSARLRTGGPDGDLHIESSQLGRVTFGLDSTQTPTLLPSPYETLAQINSMGELPESRLPAVGWACGSEADILTQPQGTAALDMVDQQVVLKMRRDGFDHAESHCTFTFDQYTSDVSAYQSLAIQMRMRIHGQSVTTCGMFGSECPVMVELAYRLDNTPDAPLLYWRHGFFGSRAPGDPGPLSCDTCQEQHEKLNLNAWYLYNTGNLFQLLPRERRPMRLVHLKVYASGHVYESLVTDLRVQAGTQ